MERRRGRRSLAAAPAALSAASAAGATSIFRFEDEPRLPFASYATTWGPVLCALAAVGLVAIGKRRERAAGVRRGVLAALGWLVLVHVLLDVGWREVALRRTGQAFSALTPSRWFQLASAPLAFLAGEGLDFLLALTGRTFARRRRTLPAALLGALAVASAPWLVWEYRSPSVDPELFAASAWARERLPRDAFVVVRGLPSRYWWPYLLGRETDETPLPASEPRRDPRVTEKKAALRDPEAARAVARRRGKPLFWLGPPAAPPPGGARRVAVRGVVALDADAREAR